MNNLGGNNIKFEGYSDIAAANCKELESAKLYWKTDSISHISALCLISTNWPIKCQVH